MGFHGVLWGFMASYGVSWRLMGSYAVLCGRMESYGGLMGVLWGSYGGLMGFLGVSRACNVRGKGRVSTFVTKRYRREGGV